MMDFETPAVGRPSGHAPLVALMIGAGLMAAILVAYSGISLMRASGGQDFLWNVAMANAVACPCLGCAVWLLPRMFPRMSATARGGRWLAIALAGAGFALTLAAVVAAMPR
jgi:hypothetical protein